MGAEPRDSYETTTRIISLQPSVTQTLLTIQAQDQIVGVSSFCRDLPGLNKSIPVVGDLLSPNLEKIIRLHPTCVFLHPSQNELIQSLKRLNISFVEVKTNTMEDVVNMIDLCFKVTGKSSATCLPFKDFCTLNLTNDSITSSTARPRVLFVVSRDYGSLTQLYVASDNSYHGSLLRAAGGRNALDNSSTSSTNVMLSIENIIRLNPDVIIDISSDSADEIKNSYSILKPVNALKHNKIYPLRSLTMLLPGIYASEAVTSISKVLHDN